MKSCPKCNFENDSSSEFCIECGTSLKKLKCNKCSSDNPISANFCMQCGDSLKETHKLKKVMALKEMTSEEAKNITDFTRWGFGEREILNIADKATLTYLSGIEKEDGTSIESGVYSSIIFSCKRGLYFNLLRSFSDNVYIALSYDEIINITFAEGDDIKESGSVLGGAALGGVLLGPLGAILGGMSQMGLKNTKPSLLVIRYELKNKEKGVLIFAIKQGDKSKVHNNILSNGHISHFYKPN
jgi:ribosomal protein L40E